MSSLKKRLKAKNQLQVNRIICGEVLSELAKIPDKSVNLIVTSPPYFQQRKYTDSIMEIGQEVDVQSYFQILLEVFIECKRILSPLGSICWNMGDGYKDKSLMLLPYRFAIMVLDHYKDIRLINDITWVKSNPTPRQYNRRLVNATEPFFHFTQSNYYYYDRDAFFDEEVEKPKITEKKGKGYLRQIDNSPLTDEEKINARLGVTQAIREIKGGEITDFRMKIRGIHKLAFGGQQGGRNNEIKNNGFTIIRMTGKRMKKDVIMHPVDNNKGIQHPAIFPLKVIKELILLLTYDKGLVLDPFCGSGTTCLAAKELSRKYIGIDISEKYCKISRDRLK